MDQETLSDFYLEAEELFKQAEESLLAIERSQDFQKNFSAVFRAFHSLKGAAGMLKLTRLQEHMHFLESLLEKKKAKSSMSEKLVDYLLLALDTSKTILTDGDASFDYYDPDEGKTAPLQKPLIKVNEKEKNKSSEIIKGHIFVIDDEEDILIISKAFLEENGFKVSTFSRAEAAIESLAKVSPDVIVTDISMPGMNGIEFMQQVNKIKPHLPVIVFSGFVTKEVCLDALSAGVSGILEKPFDRESFLGQVQSAYERYQAFKLMMQGIDLLIYQFEDFDKYLHEVGLNSKRQTMRKELKRLLKQKQILINRVS